ncbi:D-alanyl-D-alanine carboxypeptidase family protein [Falsibacillus albus]|uniref:serine-type D-Ala-D-Ala carboxypeptidase n=1 Tax=Falsibacillus albus TaxID=2478915 RepID=A0A3L7JWC6_9BACI|nr:D-alanyl-D-alanine carboxypeptidase family protein [Falsibacillus albus]RLQ95033.1 D-alanyl-D-alanine carboxypeptidase [Falsibacillus albus]
MKRITLMCVAAILFSLMNASTLFAKEQGVTLAPKTKSAILIERDTGSVLYDKNSHEKLPPASMTKIMTMLLIMDAIDQGRLKWDEKVRTSEYAASMGGSQIFLEPGEEMTVKQMLQGISIGSANDASVAMAEKIAGSEEAFVEMMNKKAKELGLKDTKFQNATGLPAKDHYSSAYDMAMMAKELLKHTEITKFTGTYESYLRENTDNKFWLVNTNKLVRFYPGVDGLKTGFTNEAKYCLTATAKKDNMRVIAVVFGAPTPKERNAQVTQMLDYAFSQYMTQPIYKKGQQLGEAKVSKGSEKKVQAYTDEPISVLSKKGESTKNIKKIVKLNENLKAPVKKGETVGVLIVKKDGKEVIHSNLVANKNIDAASWWQLYKKAFGMFAKVD